jgi:hypothetical protein
VQAREIQPCYWPIIGHSNSQALFWLLAPSPSLLKPSVERGRFFFCHFADRCRCSIQSLRNTGMRTRMSAPDATPTHTAPDDQLAVDDPAVAETAVAAPADTPDANHVNIMIANSQSADCNTRAHTLPPPTPLCFPPGARTACSATCTLACREEARERVRAFSRHTTTTTAR